MALHPDEIIERIGSLGKFQIRTVMVIGWISVCMALFVFAPTFLAGEPAWKCVKNSSVCNSTKEFTLGMDGYEDRCSMKRYADWDFVDTFTSITTEWDLVCDRAILASVTSSLYFAGFLVGVFALGYLSDRFGRRKTAYFGNVVCAIIAVTMAFSPNMAYFNFCRFAIGLFGGGTGMINFLICMEVSGVKHRGTTGTAMWACFVVGAMLLSPLAYFFKDWRDLALVSGIISLTIIPLWWWIPESPRWLIVNGRIKEAEELFKKIAKINGTKYPDEGIQTFVSEEKQRKANIFDLFKTRKSTYRVLIQWFAWAVNALVYYCVSLGTQSIGGNIYLTYFLLCFVEMPATLATIWSINKLGRKRSVIISLWAAAAASICAALFPMEGDTGLIAGRVLFAVIAKFMVTISFDGIYVWTGELLPTVVRNLAMGSCSSAARIGSFLSSYVNFLARIHVMLPFGVMAVTSIAAGTLCFLLPESRGQPTLEDFEDDAQEMDETCSSNNNNENNNKKCKPEDENGKEEIGKLHI